MWATLEPGSSLIDWCEENYTFTPIVAEFYNTISNILFIIIPPLLVHLFKGYSERINPYINVFWSLFIFVGLSSAYFHATLSLIGQLLDELSILWMFSVGYCIFLPKKYFPQFARNDRRKLTAVFLTVTVFCTILSLIHPTVNAIILMILGVPVMGFLYYLIQRIKSNVRVYRLGIRCLSVWMVAVFCWLNDRLFCDAWSYINNFRYFHGLWHIFIFIAAYTAGVVYAYIIVEYDKPEKKAILRYWPRNDFEWGIPYIIIKD